MQTSIQVVSDFLLMARTKSIRTLNSLKKSNKPEGMSSSLFAFTTKNATVMVMTTNKSFGNNFQNRCISRLLILLSYPQCPEQPDSLSPHDEHEFIDPSSSCSVASLTSIIFPVKNRSSPAM